MFDPQFIWRVNRHPRFTALEMGEYMAADDGPRETMLRNMKYERLARTLTYRNVSQAVSAFLASPTRDRGILTRCRIALEHERDAAENPQSRENFVYELRALETFERSLNALELAGLTIERAPQNGRALAIEGVTVNVRPTAHIRQRRQRGADLVGAVVVDLAKGVLPRTPEAQARLTAGMTHGAILLHQYVTDVFVDEADARPSLEHCIIFHTHRQERVAAPSNYRRMLRNIEAVCRNIARGWDNVAPPGNFDATRARYRN